MEAIDLEFKKQEKKLSESMKQLKELISNIMRLEQEGNCKPLEKAISGVLEEMSKIPVSINKLCLDKGNLFKSKPEARPVVKVELKNQSYKQDVTQFKEDPDRRVSGAIYASKPEERTLIQSLNNRILTLKNEALDIKFEQMPGNRLINSGFLPQVNAHHGFVSALRSMPSRDKQVIDIIYFPLDHKKRHEYQEQKQKNKHSVTLSRDVAYVCLTDPLQEMGKDNFPQLFIQTSDEIQFIKSLTEGTPEPEPFCKLSVEDNDFQSFAVIGRLFFVFLKVEDSFKIEPYLLKQKNRPQGIKSPEGSESSYKIPKITKFILREKSTEKAPGDQSGPTVDLFILVDNSTVYYASYTAQGTRRSEQLLKLPSSEYKILDISFNETVGYLFLLLQAKGKNSTLKVKAIGVADKGMDSFQKDKVDYMGETFKTRSLDITKEDIPGRDWYFNAELCDATLKTPLIFLCTDERSFHYSFEYGEKGDEVFKTKKEFKVFREPGLHLARVDYNPQQKSLVMLLEEEEDNSEEEEMKDNKKGGSSASSSKGKTSNILATLQVQGQAALM